jgi:nucleoside 2-deoxyribosyltransferase
VIIKDILQAIRKADYIIADLSQPNPNVYYEMGFAHALRKPVILITRNLESLPFDLRHQRVIIYQDSAQGAEALRDALKKYISQI